MKFQINNRNWLIEELPSDVILKKYNDEMGEATYCFGLTNYPTQTIYINEELNLEVKKQTLYHELMHCYIWNYLSNISECDIEMLCNISANSHDVIHKIATKYFDWKQTPHS